MKKLISYAICTLMIASVTPNISSTGNALAASLKYENEVSTKLPNPFVDCQTLNEAKKLAGFNISLPSNVISNDCSFSVIKNELLEINYKEKADEVCIRKSVKEKDINDISGIYKKYPENKSVKIKGKQVTLRGSNGKISVATWETKYYTYSIVINNGDVENSINRNHLLKLIKKIK